MMLATVGLAAAWRNAAHSLDVNHDTSVAPIDAVLVINYLNSGRPAQLPEQYVAPQPFYDTDGDGFVSPVDAVLVINALNAASTELTDLPEAAAGCNLVVTTTSDTGPGSLREALNCANSTPGTDTITFGGVYSDISPDVITLTSGELLVGSDLTIQGPGASLLKLSGNNASRVLRVGAGATVAVSGVTIADGNGVGGGIGPKGGGIYNEGTLTLRNVVISGNRTRGIGGSPDNGGGIHNINGTLVLIQSTVDNNFAYGTGGGINNDGGSVSLLSSTLSNNSCADGGGGIRNFNGTLTIHNSTISGNFSGLFGGGIANSSGRTLVITNSTITANGSYNERGGISTSSGTMLRNSIVAGNYKGGFSLPVFPSDIGGTIDAATNNLIGDAGTAGNLVHDADGNLATGSNNIVGNNGTGTISIGTVIGPLTDNGGPTKTHDLISGSPAIDRGSNAHAVDAQNQPLMTDQRGVNFARIVNNVVDIGAFEFVPAPIGPPNAVDDSYSTAEGTVLTVPAPGVLGNDIRSQNGTLTAVLDSGPLHGTVNLNLTLGSFSYSPSANFSGIDHFTYHVTDGSNSSGKATVTIMVTPVNDPPSGSDKVIRTLENTPYIFILNDVFLSDSVDVPANSLHAVRIASLPASGSLLHNGVSVVVGQFIPVGDITSGGLRYIPPINGVGDVASFTFQLQDDGGTANGGVDLDPTPNKITINVLPVNDAPVAVADAFHAALDAPLSVSAPGIMANDSDTNEDDTKTVVAVNGPTARVLWDEAINGDFPGVFGQPPVLMLQPGRNEVRGTTGQPATGTGDFDRFVIHVPDDAQLTSVAWSFSRTVGGLGLVNWDVYAGAAFPATQLASDSIGVPANEAFDGLTLPLGPGHYLFRESSFSHAGGVVPSLGAYTFRFQLSRDVSVGVPLSLASGARLTVNADGSFVYDANGQFEWLGAGQTATDSFTYTMADSEGSESSATVSVTVQGTNQPPAAAHDAFAVSEDLPLNVFAPGVLSNDGDADGDVLTASLVAGPIHGTLALQPNGGFTYTPTADFHGPESFTYRADDGAAFSNLATVTISVIPLNDAPIAADDAYSTTANTLLSRAAPGPLANDADIDGDALTAVIDSGPAHGVLSLGPSGAFTYVPNADYVGPDSVAYRASDGVSTSNVALASINVRPATPTGPAVLTAELIKDINTAPGGVQIHGNSLINFHGHAYFSGSLDGSDIELWRSDGTAGGTRRVRDIKEGPLGSRPSNLTAVGVLIFFTADDGAGGYELWKSDGTESGTVLVKEIHPGLRGSFPRNMLNVNTALYFSANDGVTGYELWRSDGSTEGTMLVRDIASGERGSYPRYLTNVNGSLFFAANDGISGYELWKSDGGGTVLVKDIRPGVDSYSSVRELTNVAGTLFFRHDDGEQGAELWKSDGSEEGTQIVADIRPGFGGSNPSELTAVNESLFFAASQDGGEPVLWKSDGTEAGTFPIGGSSLPLASPSHLTEVDDDLFFFTSAGLWKTEAAGGIPELMGPVAAPSAFSDLNHTVNINGTFYFSGGDGAHGQELWRSDGTPEGTILLKDTLGGIQGGEPYFLTNVGGRLFFAASDGTSEAELWTSDGTHNGTQRVLVGNGSTASSVPSPAVVVGDLAFFAATDFEGGRELWRTDGTLAGTVRVADLIPGPSGSFPRYLTNVGGTLFFVADDGLGGAELWKSNGTAAGTVLVKDIRPGSGSSLPHDLIHVNGVLFFAANDGVSGFELWRSDGTADGTIQVTDIQPGGGSSYPRSLTNVNGTLFFRATGGTTGLELWKSDGTEAGTALVRDIRAGSASSYLHYLTNVGGQLFFAASTAASGIELWTSDGTETGTRLVRDIRPGAASALPRHLTNVNGRLFFRADDGAAGEELWSSDGTTAGTVLVRDIRLGPGGSTPAYLTNVGGTLFFAAAGNATNVELWKSDGTAAGTVLVAEIEPDSAGSFPALLTNVGGRLFFSAETFATGRELWTSDGTEAGTFLVADIVPEAASSLPGNIVAFGDLPLFTANDRVHGRELWTVIAVAVNRPPVAANDSFVVVVHTTLGIAAPGLLANDTDPDGNALSAVLETGPASGTLSLAPSGAFTFVPAAGFVGTDSFTYRASDGQALSAVATVSLVVTTASAPPVVTLNPASPANEGSTFTASGSFVDLDATGPWTASVNYGDGSGPQPLALAADKTFTLSHIFRDNGIFSVSVVVTDAGGASGAASLATDIRNVAPQNLTFAGPSAGSRGQAIGFSGSFTDPGLADTHTARIDWGDGSISTPLVTGSGGLRQVAATHTYQAGGIYRPTLTVIDDDGGSASQQREVVIEVVVVGVGLHNGVLEIIGSAENDSITVAIVQGGGLQVFGSMGGTTISQSFDAGSVERIVALMGGGSDMLTVSSTVPLPLFADGGGGSDTLFAGGGAAILLGGPGNDALKGGTRRDLLIGGVGLDQINAAGASDLLIAGRTAYDADQAALAAILAEWSAAGTYQDRVARLRSGTGAIIQPLGIKLTFNQTVFDDTVVDKLWGGSETDWFFYDPSRDQPLDKLASEVNR